MSRDQRLALEAMLRKAPQPFGPVPVEQLRERFAAFMATFPIPTGVRRIPTELAGRPALLVEREEDAQPGTILYFHGGGNVFGSPETALQLTANLVARTGFRAFSLDYRLAPSTRARCGRRRDPRHHSRGAARVPVFVGTLDEADQALGRAALFLTQHLAGKRGD